MGRGPRRKKAPTVESNTGGETEQAKEEGGGKRKRQESVEEPLEAPEAEKQLLAWCDDAKKQKRWLTSRGGGLADYLSEAKGKMVSLRDFFPLEVADCVLSVLENLPEEAWDLSEQAGDAGAASHRFWSADVCDIPALAPLRGVFWSLLSQFQDEPTLPIFSCGRYGKTDFIERHDDRAHVPFNGSSNMYSRTVGAVWHLTREWQAREGGLLLDLEGEAEVRHVPTFNTLVAFEVPHWHAVTAVEGERYRYSIFGWWHQKGKRYDLPGAPASEAGAGGGRKRPAKKRKVVPNQKEEEAQQS